MRLFPARLHLRADPGLVAVLATLLLLQIAQATVVAARRVPGRPVAVATSYDAEPRDPKVLVTRPTVVPPAPTVGKPVVSPQRPKPKPHPVVAKPKPHKAKPKPRRDTLAALRGLSAWVDLYDYGKTGPAAAAALADTPGVSGVTTIWVETSRYNTADIAYAAALGALMDRAAARRIKVVAWVLPEFRSVSADLAKARAAAAFRSPGGRRFAALGLDIEVSSGAKPPQRTSRLLSLAQQLHGRIGMPLVAITPPPVGFSRHPTYWPGFPWRSLAARADAIATMGYWSYSKDAEPGAYTRTVLQQTRQLVGRASYPIHVIGGLAANTTKQGAASFCRAADTGAAIGASLYDLRSTPAALWAALQACRRVGH